MSAGIVPLHRAVLLDRLADRARDQRVGELAVGRALVGAGRRRGVVARAGGRRPRVEVLGPGEGLADELAADRPGR